MGASPTATRCMLSTAFRSLSTRSSYLSSSTAFASAALKRPVLANYRAMSSIPVPKDFVRRLPFLHHPFSRIFYLNLTLHLHTHRTLVSTLTSRTKTLRSTSSLYAGKKKKLSRWARAIQHTADRSLFCLTRNLRHGDSSAVSSSLPLRT